MADTAPKVAATEHHDPIETVNKKAELLAQYIQKSKHFIVFTGAGISTSAGIPDFRGPDGSWTLLAQGRQRTKKTTSTLQAIPTPAHMALVALQDCGLLKYVVSQNCDGLHRRSGITSDRISEVHGNSNLEYCKECGKEYLRDFRAVSTYEKGIHDHRTGRRCALCDGVLLDTIINFGESLPEKAFQRADKNAKQADLCLVLGSSCTVTPANEIPNIVGSRKAARLAICNLQDTPLDRSSSWRVYTTADELMIRVMDKLNIDIPRFILRRYLTVTIASDEEERSRVTVLGIDADGTPMSFLQSVKVEGSRRISRNEPHVFNLRDELTLDTTLKLELEFMGHYNEPNLIIDHRVGIIPCSYLIEFDPHTGQWVTFPRK